MSQNFTQNAKATKSDAPLPDYRRADRNDPLVRVGNCCGCDTYPVTLHKIPGLSRYRCAECFAIETGNAA